MRPGRLDSLIYIGLPDFDARISIFKACLRKSPVDPEVDYEYMADRTEGFSGADISGICKSAAKHAIRTCIDQERKKFEAKEKKKQAAAEKGEEYVSDDETDMKESDNAPFITKAMLLSALSNSRRSVTKQDLERYMKYKRDMERRLGMDEGVSEANLGSQMNRIVGLEPENRRRPGMPAAPGQPLGATPNPAASTAPRTAPSASQPTAGGGATRNFADEEADDDIYGD